MASPTAPTHGKFGAIYRYRSNGFKGVGLSDVTWGSVWTGTASTYIDVAIFSAGTPDTYQFREDGGAWDDNTGSGFPITGAAQTVVAGQQITFAATTGHTVADQWTIGNLYNEPTTLSGPDAQITALANRVLNVNNKPTFTDTGSELVLRTNFTNGTATFTANPTVVTVSGINGFVPTTALEKVGYATDWSFNVSLDIADTSIMGTHWKSSLPGQAGASGSVAGMFIGGKSFLEALAVQEYFFVELYSYDPDQDQTGDCFICWAIFSTTSVSAAVGDVVKESVDFTTEGVPTFVSNV